MHNLIVHKSQLVTARIETAPHVNKEFKFKDVGNLSRNNVMVYGITAYTRDELTKSPNDKAVVSAAGAKGLLVTLQDNENNEPVHLMPYTEMVRAKNSGLILLTKPMILDLTQCKIQISDAAGLAIDEEAVFNVFYEYL